MTYSRPLVHLARSTPLAGRALHRRLRSLLHHHAVYIPPPNPSAGSTAANRPEQPVPLHYLSDRVIEQVLTKGCIAGQLPNPYSPETDSMDVDPPAISTGETDEASLMGALRERYSSSSSTKDRSFRIPHSSSPRDGQGTLVIPGWVLERAAEVLFDPDVSGDEADTIPQAILTTLLKVR